jgi:glycosyltransferase involved in cell wall biosynthesis
MQIIINTIAENNGISGSCCYSLYESFPRLTKANPEHLFIFLTDDSHEEQFESAQNAKTIKIKQPSKNLLRKKWWFDANLPALLKKHKADLFVSTDIFCSLRTKVPQIIIPGAFSFHHSISYLSKTQLFFYRRFSPAFIQKAKSVIAFSEFEKREMVRVHGVNHEKIDVLYANAGSFFKPLDFETREKIKKDYAEGKEFFLYSGPIGPEKNLVTLLKAFSLLKKRQQSNIKLLIVGKLSSGHDLFLKSLETYKYRDDIIVIKNADELMLAGITASAFALVYPALADMPYLPVMEAMQSGIAVITSSSSPMAEVAGDAALLAGAGSPKEIAEQMMRIYKDEKLWKDLMQKSKERSFYFSAEKTDESLWQCIQKALTRSIE